MSYGTSTYGESPYGGTSSDAPSDWAGLASVTVGLVGALTLAEAAAGSVSVVVGLTGNLTGLVATVVVPPIEGVVEPTANVLTSIPAVPIEVIPSVRAPVSVRCTRELLDPEDATTVPVLRPVFTVGVTLTEGDLETLTVEVQYDDNTSFTSPVSLTQAVDLVENENVVRIPALADLPTSVPIYWRARLIFNSNTWAWTDYWQLTVDTTAGDHLISVVSIVTTTTPDPHLWFFTPEGAIVGSTVTIVGQGFSTAEGTVTLAGVTMPIVSWSHIAATGAAVTTGRVITSTLVDPEHDEVVVTVPDVAPPGGGIVVDGS